MGLRGRSNLTNETFFFITTTVVRFLPVFTNHNVCELLIKNIKYYQKKYRFKILGYVIMPSHFHWIIQNDPTMGTVSSIMRDIKKYTAWDVLDYLSKSEEYKRIFESEAKNYSDQKRKLWMPRFDDNVISTKKEFYGNLKYIHENPVKSSLVKKEVDYKYSSARNYLLNDHSVLFVDTDVVGY